MKKLNGELIEIKHTDARDVRSRVRYLVVLVLVRRDYPCMKQACGIYRAGILRQFTAFCYF